MGAGTPQCGFALRVLVLDTESVGPTAFAVEIIHGRFVLAGVLFSATTVFDGVHSPTVRVIAPRTQVNWAGDYPMKRTQFFFAPAPREARAREVVREVLPNSSAHPTESLGMRALTRAEPRRGTFGREIDFTYSRQATDRAVGAGAPKVAHDLRVCGLVDELEPPAAQTVFERDAAYRFGNWVVVMGRAPEWESFRVAAAVVDFTEQSAGRNADAFGGECVVPTELRFRERVVAIQLTGV